MSEIMHNFVFRDLKLKLKIARFFNLEKMFLCVCVCAEYEKIVVGI